MLEWYRIGWNHEQLVKEAAALVQAALALVGRSGQLRVVRYRDLYRNTLGIDPFTADDATLHAALGDVVIDPAGLSRDDWLDLLMTHRLQPNFNADEMLAVVDYPASQCALARIVSDAEGHPVAQRFELYLGPLELANGYHELIDASEQARRFANDARVRKERGGIVPPVESRVLDAMASGLPECAGVALGVDRLLMAMLGVPRIADVLAMDFGRA